MPKLIRCEITWDKKRKLWLFTDPVSGQTVTNERFTSDGRNVRAGRAGTVIKLTKAAFVRSVSSMLNKLHAEQGLNFSLRIRNQQNEFQEERTLPHSADPRRSKG